MRNTHEGRRVSTSWIPVFAGMTALGRTSLPNSGGDPLWSPIFVRPRFREGTGARPYVETLPGKT